MSNVLNVLAIVINTFFLMKAIKQLFKGSTYSIHFVFLVFYIFFIVPLLLDLLIGTPIYTYETGFKYASADRVTKELYAVFMILVPFIWRFTSKSPQSFKEIEGTLKISSFIKIIMYLFVIAPCVVVAFAPFPSIYLEYGRAVLGFPNIESQNYHQYIQLISLVSIVASAFLLAFKKPHFWMRSISLVPFVFFDLWINGKRMIVVLFIFLLLYVVWKQKVLKTAGLIGLCLVSISAFLSYTFLYQEQFRYDMLQINDQAEVYHNMRVDYGRDDVAKLSIYSLINKEEVKILEYPGQSILFDMAMFIPREVWPNKPWPYAVYLTSAMLMIPPQNIGWSMTTSILDEAIANFGWLGFFVGPLLISLICRVGDKTQNMFAHLTTILVGSLLLVVQLAAFVPIFIFWLCIISHDRLRRKVKIVW